MHVFYVDLVTFLITHFNNNETSSSLEPTQTISKVPCMASYCG